MKYLIENNQYKVYGKGILFNNGLALNETATDIFLLCKSKKTFEQLVDGLEKIYEIKDINNFREEIRECLKIMKDNEIIKEVL